MVKLNMLINQLKEIDGYIHHFLRYKDNNDLTQYYKFFVEKDNKVKAYEVRLLVINEGEENEDAYIYEIPKDIDTRPKGEFETLLESTVEAYQSNNPALEYYEINSVDEVNDKARVTGYFLENGVLVRKEFLSFMLEDKIKFREIS